jgi:uncharacterized membrane protein
MDTEIQPGESAPPSKLPQTTATVQTSAPDGTLQLTEFLALARSYSGPLPDPETMERYEALTPGAADRMISMAEESLRHQNEIEKLDLTSLVNMQTNFAEMDARITRRGQDRAFGATLLLTRLQDGWPICNSRIFPRFLSHRHCFM